MRKTLSLLAIIAALSSSALAGDSTVTLSGGAFQGTSYYGNGNVTIAEGGTINVFMLIGKQGATGEEASGSTVNMTGGTLTCNAYSGRSSTGVATSNTFSISGGTVTGMVRGGDATAGNATNNAVTISGGEVESEVRGGSTSTGVATTNTVTVSGGKAKDKVYGGYSRDSNATGNTVTISSGEVGGNVYGGYSSNMGNATYNTVTITGGTINDDVFGGYSPNGDTTNNTVTISGGQQNGYVYGGKTTQGDANNNTVTITAGSVEYSVYGGSSNQGNANNNTVTISGGSVNDYIYGGISGYAAANGNTVTISGGTLSSAVQGGHGETEANNNTVTISGGTLSYNVSGGFSSGNANGNTVTISGGSVTGDVHGGYSSSGNASNNTVNLVGEGATLGTLTGSSFTIDGMVNVAAGNTRTNNTLNVYGKGITVKKGIWANTVNFYLAPGTQNGDIILTMSEGIFRTDNLNVKCSGETLLTTGDKVTLIHVVDYVSIDIANTPNVDIIKGVTATYSGTVAKVGDDLVLTVGDDSPVPGPIPGPEPTPVPGPGVKVEFDTLKSMTETRTDVAALVNATADFMSTAGLQQAKLAAKSAAAAGKYEAAPFVALGGSHLRYNTGSHVNANGFNAALGVAKAVSAVTLGVAGEYGTSDYKSYVGGVRGNGDSKLFGGAVLADWQGKQGWHTEGSVHLGRARYDYNAMTPLGHTDYSDKASYQSVSIGGGKEFKVSSKSEDTIDLYARYIYGHTNGSNAKASSGESMHFAGVNSHRTMVGARYNHELTDSAVLYAGAAWMHEFDGDAHSVIGGFTSPAPSLKGDSGMLELGTTFAPLDSQNVLINLNVQGWTGVQRGISGGAGCTIRF